MPCFIILPNSSLSILHIDRVLIPVQSKVINSRFCDCILCQALMQTQGCITLIQAARHSYNTSLQSVNVVSYFHAAMHQLAKDCSSCDDKALHAIMWPAHHMSAPDHGQSSGMYANKEPIARCAVSGGV